MTRRRHRTTADISLELLLGPQSGPSKGRICDPRRIRAWAVSRWHRRSRLGGTRRGTSKPHRVVLGMAVHPSRLAATRLRLTQYFDYIQEDGTGCVLWTFLADEHLPAWYGPSTFRRTLVLLRAALRLPRAVLLIR